MSKKVLYVAVVILLICQLVSNLVDISQYNQLDELKQWQENVEKNGINL